MATTFLQAINKVLQKVGEDQLSVSVTSITTTYELLIASMVNDIKEQIEDAHNWRALRQTVSTTVAADAVSSTITEADERSRVVRINKADLGGSIPLVFDITDASSPDPLIEMDLAELLYRDAIDPDQRQDPTYFALDNSSGNVLDLYVWPRPSGARTIQSTLIIPQAELDPADGADLGTNIKIPIRPLIMGAVWYALEERGEELGTQGLFNEQRFTDALNSAISRDDAEQGNVHELVAV
jgi:hypothetical protein